MSRLWNPKLDRLGIRLVVSQSKVKSALLHLSANIRSRLISLQQIFFGTQAASKTVDYEQAAGLQKVWWCKDCTVLCLLHIIMGTAIFTLSLFTVVAMMLSFVFLFILVTRDTMPLCVCASALH